MAVEGDLLLLFLLRQLARWRRTNRLSFAYWLVSFSSL